MKEVILGHTIFWGVLVLSGILWIISFVIEIIQTWLSNERKGKQILKLVFYVFVILGPAYCFYIMANKYISNPIPSNPQIVMAEEEEWMQYQDTTHRCPTNSSWFHSRTQADSKPNKDDVCEECGCRFIDHDTPQEQSYFKWMFILNHTD